MLQLTDLRLSDHAQLVVGATCLCIIALISRAYLSSTESSLSFPPSPLTWRLRGHLIPTRNGFLTVASWIEEYGPLITLRTGIEKYIVIGRYKAAAEIMEKQGASLVDRPRFIAAGELLSGGMAIPFVPAGERFRRLRRLVPKAAEAYQPLQISYAKNTVIDILNDPCNFQDHARTYAATTSMKIAYGKTTPTSATDPEVKRVAEFADKVRAALHPGAYLVDSITWLKYLPWYARELRDSYRDSRKLFIEQLGRLKQELGGGEASPSLGRRLLEKNSSNAMPELEIAYLAGMVFVAGYDTTTLAICTVLMAAACFPEEQRKVHEELDAVIGTDRAPAFTDKKSLPRFHAFVSEALRWRPLFTCLKKLHLTVQTGRLSYSSRDNDIWQSLVRALLSNLIDLICSRFRAISRDPDVFPDPNAFKPDRWLDTEGRVRDDLKFFVFGFGRRVCPGQHVANSSVFINTVLTLWAFRLTLDRTKPLDDAAFMNGILPNEQPCTIDFQTRIPEAELRRIMGGTLGTLESEVWLRSSQSHAGDEQHRRSQITALASKYIVIYVPVMKECGVCACVATNARNSVIPFH
ncbi:cytochrome P450 [Suillus subaureus]|uniref:Cytochrome P450 n=1 Tax=Suillus subaureus TaxID=48587 RepID=A0A9P7J427_9AGAM|nr:cytochrome P450 [Suillus subaureus]KAG1801739.1 cytochrome P450 [Suillus subaureus]